MKTVFHYKPDQKKVCGKCGVTKSVHKFNEAKKQPDGLYPWCLQCQNKKYRRKKPQPIKSGNKDLDKDMKKLNYWQPFLQRPL